MTPRLRPLLFALAFAAGLAAPADDGVQVAAYYFPNWHRHDGVFGEWDALTNAKPRFPGHQQPKVPAWGIEDEADPAAMARKIEAAADHGIAAFSFCWYFNGGGPYLERALNEGYLRATNRARVKFSLMWANHDANRHRGAIDRPTFDRLVDHVVADYLTQPTAWQIDGRPVFSIYEIGTFIQGLGGLEAAADAIRHFRERAKAAGLAGIHLSVMDWQLARRDDAAEVVNRLGVDSSTSYCWVHHIGTRKAPAEDYVDFANRYFDWRGAKHFGVPHWPNVMMGWDPSPRVPAGQPLDNRGYPNTSVLTNNTPAHFRAALARARGEAARLPPSQRIVTVYAWNEWTEGGYLEPETAGGSACLDAIREVFTAPGR